MTFLQLILLAAVQGAAELLPVSSSAHVIFFSKLMGLDPGSPQMTFLIVMLHTGTMGAVLLHFWKRWLSPAFWTRELFFKIFIALLGTGVVGLSLKFIIEKIVLEKMLGHSHGEVEHLFRSLPLIACALFAAGSLILVSSRFEKKAKQGQISGASAVWIGIIQGLCLPFRGFSRSGATISTGIIRGIPQALSEEFSFALAIFITPPVILLEFRRLLHHSQANLMGEASVDWGPLLLPGALGMALSFLSGWIALRFLSKRLENGQWKFFGYYCYFFAAVLAISSAVGVFH